MSTPEDRLVFRISPKLTPSAALRRIWQDDHIDESIAGAALQELVKRGRHPRTLQIVGVKKARAIADKIADAAPQ